MFQIEILAISTCNGNMLINFCLCSEPLSRHKNFFVSLLSTFSLKSSESQNFWKREISFSDSPSLWTQKLYQKSKEIQFPIKLILQFSYFPSCTTLFLNAIPQPTALGLQTGRYGSARQEIRKLKNNHKAK